jgi:alkanesulfonate monooxygenase SsuD/methylene tetrahydromethanopterin reductase-like flavin-dependent oxidoreductase (luciferase family)
MVPHEEFSFAMPNTVRVKALTQPFELEVTGADQIVMAQRAEELGYEMIPTPEHFIVPNAHVDLTGPHYFHSTVAQAFIAGATRRIRVNSSVTLLPLPHPIIMAKALSTADWMSNDRTVGDRGSQAEGAVGFSSSDRYRRPPAVRGPTAHRPASHSRATRR